MPPHRAMMLIYGLHVFFCTFSELVAKLRPDTGVRFWSLEYRPSPHAFFAIAATEFYLAGAMAVFATKFYYQYVSFSEIDKT
jgi:hypothetical protein